MKILMVVTLLLQSLAFSGVVCGNHVTTAESMACCEKGHNDGASGIHDPHSATCCASCDMGKTSAIKRQDHVFIEVTQTISSTIIPLMLDTKETQFSFELKHEYPPGGSEILLLKQTLRI
jgi:hypothetical protein